MFDHAEEGGIAVFIAADFTEAVFREKSAFRTGLDLGPCFFDGMGEIFGCSGGGGEEVEGKTLGGTGAHAWKFTQRGDEAESGGRVVGHPERSGISPGRRSGRRTPSTRL